MSVKMKHDDPAYWMLFDGVETTPIVYSADCYICNDNEFSKMGLPLCRKCPVCGGHIPADDGICDNCKLDEESFWMEVDNKDINQIAFLEYVVNDGCQFGEYKSIQPSEYLLSLAHDAYTDKLTTQ